MHSCVQDDTMTSREPGFPDGVVVTFPVRSGILGADRLARGLKALQADGGIGEWHVGHWIDWRHTGIRISFETEADASRAERDCHDAGTPTDLHL
jgi:hypothetical protein